MLQKSLLFSHTAERDKNYNTELELNSSKTFDDYSAVLITCIITESLGLIGNRIIFCLLCCIIKKTKFTLYAANLALGDLVLLHSLCFDIELYTTGIFTNRLGKVLLVLFFFGYENSSYFLAAMSMERCLTVFSPNWYQSHRQKCSTAIVCAFIWVMTVTLTMLVYFLCNEIYISDSYIRRLPCKIATVVSDTITNKILNFLMVFSILALCIRMKIKPQQDFPARLDISIWITVGLHLIFFPGFQIIDNILSHIPSFSYLTELMYVEMIFHSMACCVKPFVYLLVGCWKWEKGQEPFYIFLERALKDNGKGSMSTQPDQEQA